MPRKNIYISDKVLAILLDAAKENNLNASEYISQLILNAASKKPENIAEIREEMERLRRAENANGKNITALVEMLNTYFKMFAVGDNENVFFPVDESPHPWTRKGLEVAESKIRMAVYSRMRWKSQSK